MAEITREQVEHLRTLEPSDAAAQMAHADHSWFSWVPIYVRVAYHDGIEAFHAALTRWRDSLPVAKVARWVDDPQPPARAYRLEPPHDGDHGPVYWTSDRTQAIDWGYTIEGEPDVDATGRFAVDVPFLPRDVLIVELRDPDGNMLRARVFYGKRPGPKPKVAEDSPERLKARREALGWDTGDAALRSMLADIDAQHGGPPRKWGSLDWLEEQHGFDPVDPDRLGTLDRPFPPRDRPEPTAATSNGTAGGYVDGRLAMGGGGVKPERPEPRYKVGDWVRVTMPGYNDVYQVTEVGTYGSEYFYRYHPDGGWSESNLAPALDPALHETARRTVEPCESEYVARSRCGECGADLGPAAERLPQHVPQPVPQVEQPPASADGQQHGDDGEGV